MDRGSESVEHALWGANLRKALGYSTIYALVLTLALLADHVLRAGPLGGRGLALSFFIPVLGVVFALNVLARASGVATVVATRVTSPVRLNVVACLVLGVAIVVW